MDVIAAFFCLILRVPQYQHQCYEDKCIQSKQHACMSKNTLPVCNF